MYDLDPDLDPMGASRKLFRAARAQIEASGLTFVGELPPYNTTSLDARNAKFMGLAVRSGKRFTDITKADLRISTIP
jgi:hypothetical protein